MTPKEIVPLSAAIDDILKSMGHKTHKLAKASDGEIILTSICAERYMHGNQSLPLKVMQEIGYVGRGTLIASL
jgi:hypothetical protein